MAISETRDHHQPLYPLSQWYHYTFTSYEYELVKRFLNWISFCCLTTVLSFDNHPFWNFYLWLMSQYAFEYVLEVNAIRAERTDQKAREKKNHVEQNEKKRNRCNRSHATFVFVLVAEYKKNNVDSERYSFVQRGTLYFLTIRIIRWYRLDDWLISLKGRYR